MPGSRIDFFGDESDLAEAFQRFDSIGELVFTENLSVLNRQNLSYESSLPLMNFLEGANTSNKSRIFLVTRKQTKLTPREVVMKDGSGIKHAVDELLNPDSIRILLGGIAAPSTIVTTSITTTGETQEARELFKEFKVRIVKFSQRVGVYYVLPRALDKLHKGWRLTPGVGYAPSMDLKVR